MQKKHRRKRHASRNQKRRRKAKNHTEWIGEIAEAVIEVILELLS